MKNWKTTVGVVFGAILVVVGLVLPDQVDPETQEVLRVAFAEVLSGVGVLISTITGILAKDPE
jgi:hypothetical protein